MIGKSPRQKQGQRSRDEAARRPSRSHQLPGWLRATVKPEAWIVALFLSLGLGAALLASLLGSLGGPSLDLNLMIGAVVLVATTILLGFLVLSGSQAEGEPDKNQQEE